MGRRSSGRQSSGEGGAYVFPRHPTEVDRLDLQHYALREAIGANYLAPGIRWRWHGFMPG